jgi:AMP nucleosidase
MPVFYLELLFYFYNNQIAAMKSKEEIVNNWLPRYTGLSPEKFGKYILLTNFQRYVELFAQKFNVPVDGEERNMPSATSNDITILNFGMGSPNAATVMDLLSAVAPSAVLFLGKCGGLKISNNVGDLILPIAAIRHDGTSDDYLPPEVPALPAFNLQRAVSTSIRDHGRDYYTGVVFTTNRRVWEYDNRFKKYLKRTRAMAIDMETATIFITGFANQIPTGALLLVSDQPMISTGVKTDASDRSVTEKFVDEHVQIGIDAMKLLRDNGRSVKHLKFFDE